MHYSRFSILLLILCFFVGCTKKDSNPVSNTNTPDPLVGNWLLTSMTINSKPASHDTLLGVLEKLQLQANSSGKLFWSYNAVIGDSESFNWSTAHDSLVMAISDSGGGHTYKYPYSVSGDLLTLQRIYQGGLFSTFYPWINVYKKQ